MDHITLFTLQSGLGLGDIAARIVYRYIYTVRRRFRPVGSGLQQQEEQKVQ